MNFVKSPEAFVQKDLPQGWALAKLGEIRWDDAKTVDPARSINEEFELYSVPSFESDAPEVLFGRYIGSTKQTTVGDTVLVCKINPRINRIWKVKEHTDRRQIASTEWIQFWPVKGVDPDYLRYYLSQHEFRDYLASNVSGVGGSLMRVRSVTLTPYPFPVAPVSEQQRIVAKIDELFSELDAGVASLKHARTLLKKYRQSVLKAAVTGELTRDWRERHTDICSGSVDLDDIWAIRRKAAASAGKQLPRARSLNRAELWSVPESWVWCSVDEAGDVQLGQQRAPQHHKGQHMRPYLRVANVLEDELDLSDVKSMNFEPKELSKFELEPGDILLNEGQAPDLLGRSAIFNGEINGCCIQKTLLRFRAYGKGSHRFAQIVFRHYMHSGRFKKISRITTNIGHLTRVRFVALEFPFPPIQEQEEIANRFESIDTNIKCLERLLRTQFDAPLRQSILKAAFAGKLVPRDPNDEPAGVLLERIRAERAARPQPARGRRWKVGPRQLEVLR